MGTLSKTYTTQTRITRDTTVAQLESKKIKLSEDYFALCEMIEVLTNTIARNK